MQQFRRRYIQPTRRHPTSHGRDIHGENISLDTIFGISDCQCETIEVSLSSKLNYQYYGVEGKYEKSAPAQGKPTWTSNIDAIWYNSEFDDWVIGPKEDIGKNICI